MMELFDRLKFLLEDKKVAEVAANVGLTEQTIYNYLANKTTPEYAELILLADYFECTIDYLSGRGEDCETTFKKCPPFAERLKEVFKINKTTESKIYKKIKISRSIFYAWLTGKSEPSLGNLVKLAEYFKYTIDFIVGREA